MKNNYSRQNSLSHRHKDDSDKFREESLRAIRRRKLWSKWLFIILTILAIAIVLLAFAMYYFDA